jgi:hypothetical protein
MFRRDVVEQRRDDWTGVPFVAADRNPASGAGRVQRSQPERHPHGLESLTSDSTAIMQTLPPTPACGDDDDDLTIAQTEGPPYAWHAGTYRCWNRASPARLLLLFARRLRLGQSSAPTFVRTLPCHLPLSLDKLCFCHFIGRGRQQCLQRRLNSVGCLGKGLSLAVGRQIVFSFRQGDL